MSDQSNTGLTMAELNRIMSELEKNPPTEEEQAKAYAAVFRFMNSPEGKALEKELGIEE